MRKIGVHIGRGAPTARALGGDRDLLKTLLATHYELTAATANQITELRALLLAGDLTDRVLARGNLSDTTLLRLIRRRAPLEASPAQIARNTDIEHLASMAKDYRNALAANRDHLTTLVNQLAPGLTAQPGTGPVTAAKNILDSTLTAWSDTPLPP